MKDTLAAGRRPGGNVPRETAGATRLHHLHGGVQHLLENQYKVPAAIHDEMIVALKTLEERMGQKLGDVNDPLLVSVRSGAKFSMPGMMDTILNLG